MKKYIKIFTIFLSLLIWCAPTLSFSAELYFETNQKEFLQGDEFLVDVYMNTDGELINATEGQVSYPKNFLEIKEVRHGNSVVNFWIESPKIGTNGEVLFSGIIPGGYQSAKGFLFSIVFQAKVSGDVAINIENPRVLKNDSVGTPVFVKSTPFKFSILENKLSKKLILEPLEDKEPPEGFKPEISRDSELFEGKWFIVFHTQDKGSGIDHYEICEGSSPCVVARSPYVLNIQKLDQRILVKAFDKNGNEKKQVFYPENWKPWYQNIKILGIIVLIAISIAIIRKYYGKII